MSAIPLAEAVERARRAIEESRLDEAKAMVEAIRAAAPEAVVTHRLWGAVLLAEDAGAAEPVLLRAVELDPEDADAWALLALARERRGETEAARALGQVAWECAPWRRELAERLLTQCREAGPDGQLWPSKAALSAWYVAQGWWTRASEECRAVLAETGERWDIRQRFCLALWWLGAREEARAEAERLLAERPEAVGAVIVAALAARERGDEAAARRHRELLWALDPTGEAVERYVPAEQWEARSWLRPAEPLVVEERWLTPSLGDTELLWELPTDEELEAARPVGDIEVEEVLTVTELSLTEEVAGGSAGEGEGEEVLWELPSEAEIEAARPGEEFERGWTSVLEELRASGLEPLSMEGLAGGREGEASAAEEERAEEIPSEEAGAVAAVPGPAVSEKEIAALEGTAGEEEGAVGREEVTSEAERPEAVTMPVGATAEEEAGRAAPAGSLVDEFQRLVAEGASGEAVRLAQRAVHQGAEEAALLVPYLERLVAEGRPGARQAAMTLGAFYRRRGETGRAARYYELALRLRSE